MNQVPEKESVKACQPLIPQSPSPSGQSNRVRAPYRHRSKIKDYDLSEDYLTKALRYFAQQEDLYNQALCYQNLGILTNYRGENELSLEHYEKATQLYQKLDNNKGILDIIINVINTRLDAQNLDQLETLLSQGMELANKIVEPYSQALLYNLYGNYYLQKRNFVAAEESLLKSEKLFLSLGANGNVRLIYNLLLQVYVQPGYESSFFSETLKKYDAVSVEIFDKERSKDLVEYNVIYETEKKENEILWLETIAITERYRRNVFLIFSLFGAIVSLLAILLLLKRHKRLKLQQILLNERNHHYKELLELKNRELATQSIQIAKRNESINNLIKKIKNYASNQSAESRKSILKITPMLKELTSSENGWWKEFELRFTQLNKDFLTRLLTSNPELSPIEIRICSLLRLNMGTKDIAEIMHNSVRTIENHRFRIRKKLQLDNTQSLTAYILNF